MQETMNDKEIHDFFNHYGFYPQNLESPYKFYQAVRALLTTKPQVTVEQPIVTDQRAEFEAAYRARFQRSEDGPYFSMTHHNGVYVYLPMQIAWLMWQDARKDVPTMQVQA